MFDLVSYVCRRRGHKSLDRFDDVEAKTLSDVDVKTLFHVEVKTLFVQ